jgi:hypothetical protein
MVWAPDYNGQRQEAHAKMGYKILRGWGKRRAKDIVERAFCGR